MKSSLTARVKSCQSARLNQPCRLVKLPALRAVKSSAGFARQTFEPALVRVIYGSQGRKPLVVNKRNKSPHLCGRHNRWPRKKSVIASLPHEATGYATRASAGSGMFARVYLGLTPQATICRPHKCGLKSIVDFARRVAAMQGIVLRAFRARALSVVLASLIPRQRRRNQHFVDCKL